MIARSRNSRNAKRSSSELPPRHQHLHLYHQAKAAEGSSTVSTAFNRRNCSVVGQLAELRYGADKSTRSVEAHEALDQFLAPLSVVDFDRISAGHYGTIRTDLERRGTPIGSLDLLIAAHALSLSVTLVTNNKSEYSRVPNLNIEDWAT